MAVLLASLILLFMPFLSTLSVLDERWSEANGSYSHGYILLAMVAYLLYDNYRHWPANLPCRPSMLMLVPSALLSLVWLAGSIAQFQLLEQVVMPALIFSWVLVVLGWRSALYLAPTLSLLYLAIPLWDFLLLPLREGTIGFVAMVLELLAIPALIDGFTISLPAGVLVVAGGCAGLNYLLVSLVIGSVNSVLSQGSRSFKVVSVLLFAITAVLANWVRVLLLVLIAHQSDMQSSLVQDHGFFGWVVFAVFLLPCFIVVGKLERRFKRPALERGEAVVVAPSFAAIRAALLLPLVVVVFPFWANLISAQQPDHVYRLEGDKSSANSAFWTPQYDNYDIDERRRFNAGGVSYELSILTYMAQSQGKELIYYKHQLAHESRVVKQPAQSLNDAVFNTALVKVAGRWRKVWWGYQIGDWYTGSPLAAKLLQIPATLIGKPQASLISVAAVCKTNRCAGAADADLAQPLIDQSAEWLPFLSH